MIDHHHADQRPFLTVVKWPDGWSREDVAQLIAESSGLDEPTLRLRLGKAPPTIVAQGEPAAVSNAVLALIGASGDAFAATLDDLAALRGQLGEYVYFQAAHHECRAHAFL